MANTREILKRKLSVSNICKITRTMEMVATSRFKKAHDKTVGLRSYTDNIIYLVNSLVNENTESSCELLKANSSRKRIILVFSSNRGLCGSFNSSLLRLAENHYNKVKASGSQIDLHVIGKKGISFFNFIKKSPKKTYVNIDDKTTYADIEEMANNLIGMYLRNEIGGVDVVYTCFDSSSMFYPKKVRLLPFKNIESKKSRNTGSHHVDYEFSPSPEVILQELVPAAVRTQLFQCYCDSITSEQMSRMRSMKAATDNAQSMIKDLNGLYNKARQGQITNDLMDIVGGAEALK